ncbi:MAG: PBP1A family penicillin-binding protein [Deltaproteobacteria bacterium]|nr:PBP1A family penicillin-binding protein [Deltaproteobacteria bacterium]
MFKIIKKTMASRLFWRVFLLLTIALGLYLIYLNHIIVTRFESRRWNLPSRVYSDSFKIHTGLMVSQKELISRLSHLGYRNMSGSPKHHGEYSVSGTTLNVYLHDFDYPHENFKGIPVSFDVEGGRVSEIKETNTGANIKLIQLEPELVASIFDDKMEDRTFVPLDQIPRTLTQAVILIEDERFYNHFGFDPIGIARALLANIFSGKIVQGGSTLTQQMIKNFFLTQERTLIRKFNEVLMSLIVETRYSKNEILEVYLNEIYFGQRGNASITGVAEASRFYFSKNVSQLTPDESALIAAIIKSPGIYSPFINSQNAQGRRNLVLKRLYEYHVFDTETYNRSIQRALPAKPGKLFESRPLHFVDFVKKQIKENFSQDILQSEGHRIFTTLDMHYQRAAEKAVNTWLNKLESERPALKKNTGQNLFLEGALISLHPKTGFVRAYVGGRDYTKSQFDIISEAFRQPGSVFKPFVYLTALDPKLVDPPFTPATLIEDGPVQYKTGAGPWTPKNYDNKYHGRVRLREALEMSYNAATAWLGDQAGLQNVADTAILAGMNKNIRPFHSMVLGSFEVSPLELAGAYTVFPNNGTKSSPVAIRRVVTAGGEVLEKKSFEMQKVFSADVIYLVNKMLEGVLDNGTARSSRAQGFDIKAAGKTGTTTGYKDAWFAGYTTDLLTVVWVGYHKNQTTHLSGASGALPIWTDYMKVATQNDTDKAFPSPDNIVIVPIDSKTGLLYNNQCTGHQIDEYFIEGTEPVKGCP